MQILPLDGVWEVRGFDPHGTRRITGLHGTVPGQVHADLQRAGLIPDPFWRDQADQCQWVEHWEWRYARSFHVPPEFPREWVLLEFGGLDTFATILLNGKEIGRTRNMFLPHAFDVGALIQNGRNTLEVRFAPALAAIADKPHRGQFAVFDSTGARTYIRRMQCGFGWDWVHRFVSAGIWRSCRLASYPGARLEDVFARVTRLSTGSADLALEITSTLRTIADARYVVSITGPDGSQCWAREIPAPNGTVKLDATLADPQWWWPNGSGGQPLYRLSVALCSGGDTLLDSREVEIGLRTVTLEELPDASGDGKSFTFVVNGERIFAKGGNWIPADVFPSRITPEHYTRLIDQARAAGMNMLRAWGGGIYEPEAFWRACNRMGIMITQDFLLACAEYPEQDEEFAKSFAAECAAAVRMLRNHPSLVLWCGDNELGLNSRPEQEWNMKGFHEGVTAPMLAELDPSRPFRPTSPFGGPDENNSLRGGDCHRSGMIVSEMYGGDMRDYRALINGTVGRFMSEHPIAGAPPRRTLLRFMTESDLEETSIWEYHTKDNPYVGHPLGLTYYQLLRREAEQLYGDPRADTGRAIRQMEYLHHEFARLAMEAARRRKFWCSGMLFWMYNDCWPASGWSVVDYWGGRKAGWYGQAVGCRPVIAALDVADDVVRGWICNDKRESVNVALDLRVQPWSGAARWSRRVTLAAPGNASIVAFEVARDELLGSLGNDAALVCDLAYEGGCDRSWWFPGLPREMHMPPSGLETLSEARGEGEGTITLRTGNWARVVTLDADVDFSDNYFEMLPGECRTIAWRAPSRIFEGRIGVSCWNP